MEKIIKIDLSQKENLTEKYNNRIVSKDFINYMIEQAMFIGKKDTIKVEIHNNCNLEVDIAKMIKEGLNREYQKIYKIVS